MNIDEVKQVLNEIIVARKQKVPIQGHLMYATHSQADYKLKLSLLDVKDCLDCIKPVIEKHGLAMKKSEGYLIIYSP